MFLQSPSLIGIIILSIQQCPWGVLFLFHANLPLSVTKLTGSSFSNKSCIFLPFIHSRATHHRVISYLFRFYLMSLQFLARLSHRNSVYLSHRWISQKQWKIGSPNLHRRLPAVSYTHLTLPTNREV